MLFLPKAVVYVGEKRYLYNQIFAVRVIEILRFAQYDKYHVISHSERSEESLCCIRECVVKSFYSTKPNYYGKQKEFKEGDYICC